MILLIDNYDSFSYNLFQLVGSIDPDIQVIRNDVSTPGEIRRLKPSSIIISPGPGRPEVRQGPEAAVQPPGAGGAAPGGMSAFEVGGITMTVIGITGPTGAGKTTVLKEIEALGGAVIDCDAVYHEMLESDRALQENLERAFGPLRDGQGAIDRKKLGALVFGDPAKLERLNAIAQRAVVQRTRQMVKENRSRGIGLTAIDAFALLESGLADLCTTTVAVLAPAEARVARIMAREGISEDYAWARVRAQRPDQFFAEGCAHILYNDCGTAEEFSRKAEEFLKEIV